MRFAAFLLSLFAVSSIHVSAQGIALAEPRLSVGGRQLTVVGAPLASAADSWLLSLSIPGDGTYRIATRYFDGARVAGAFENDGLFFSVGGRSIRLRSAGPIVDDAGLIPAFVLFEQAESAQERGPARLSVSEEALTPAHSGPVAETRSSLGTERPAVPSQWPDSPASRPVQSPENTDQGAGRSSAELRRQIAALSSEVDRMRDERDALLAERRLGENAVSAVESERDALQLELEIVRAAHARAVRGLSSSDAASLDEVPPVINIITDDFAPPISLPEFNFARLRNPDHIRSALEELEIPRWARVGQIAGDVRVLFQSDASGRVVRTAVTVPLGGGLDALAEDLVRMMEFVPEIVAGQPHGLRSFILVRFAAAPPPSSSL